MSEHDRLWAPWRMAYITGKSDATSDAGAPKPNAGCFLCQCRDENDDRQNYVVLRGRKCLVMLNRYPYNNGHLLVAPLEHRAALADLDDDVLLELSQLLRKMTNVLTRVMAPEGFNVGLNLGKVAGAGLPGHLHWHVVPRWNGDTNFMPVIADVAVISQSLEALYDSLVAELNPG